jgi:penicillin-binding protein 2
MGIGLTNEKPGLIPTAEWKLKRFGKRWYHGETLPVAIGQGYVLMTPIQMASMIATVANEGTVYRPFLVKRIVDTDGKTLKEFKPEVIGRTGISPANFRLVKQGLFSVVNDPGGTGGAARMYDVRVAGKTGSSQVVKLRDSKRITPYQFRDHALFVAFAPYDKPEIAIAVIVEHGEHGGSAAGPIAGRMLRAYFDGKKPVTRPAGNSTDPEDDGSEDEEPSPPQKLKHGDAAND